MRTGIIAKKVGMTRLYLVDGTHVPVTVLSLQDCQVVANQTVEKNGYFSVTIGTDNKEKIKNIPKAQKESYSKLKITPKQKIKEFKVAESNMIEVGKEIGANHFVVGQYIDVTGITIGKGFAGAMKRHNFSGLRASHGVSISHRSHGSTGNSQDPGKVFKGKKMAGHMGNKQRTIQNLQVVAADADRGLIFVKGGLPGSKGSWLALKDSVKKALPSEAPYPAGFKGEILKQEASKEEVPKQETSKEEVPKQETSKEEVPKQETSKEEAPKQETSKEEAPKQETSKEEINSDSEINTEESKDKEN